MKPKPCDYCGATYHQPYEDGLVECRENLRAERDMLRDAVEEIAKLSAKDVAKLPWAVIKVLSHAASLTRQNVVAALEPGVANSSESPNGSAPSESVEGTK